MSVLLVALALVASYKWGYSHGERDMRNRWAAVAMEPQLSWARRHFAPPPGDVK